MKKISIIVPCYGKKQNIERCIDSLLHQTYDNLEIIVINLPKNCTQQILDKDNRIKTFNIEENNLLSIIFKTSKEIKGDYITVIDINDYLDFDYFRLLINNTETNNCDIAISNMVWQKKEKKYINSLQFNLNNVVYDGKEFFSRFLKQTGIILRYQFFYNKLISKAVWNKLIIKLEKLKTKKVIEDIVFSSIIFFYAQKVSLCDDAIYFSREEKPELKASVKEIINSFDFILDMLKKEKVNDEYENYIEKWKVAHLVKCRKKNDDYNYEADSTYQKYVNEIKNDLSRNNYNELKTYYDDKLSEIKKAITNKDIEVVSFDMFDTLVVRPFLVPADMFMLLNKKFHELFKTLNVIDFGKVRRQAEQDIRKIKFEEAYICEVTLEQIYDYISKTFDLDRKVLAKIEQEEIEMEKHFCYRRNTGYALYRLAKDLGKKVVLASDIYLPKDVITKILEKNGYTFDEYYISCELLKTKANGSMFDHIIEKESTKKILHIGDNNYSDVLVPKEHGINSQHLPKSSDVFLGYTNKKVNNCGNLYKYFDVFNIDHIPYEEGYGTRCSLAMAANYYFDNPFRTFNEKTDFNADPYFIGYYALGMQTISMCKWLFDDLKENKIDSVAFMARDGYLPYEASKIYRDNVDCKKDIIFNYTYISRKSLIPLLFKDKIGLSLIDTYFCYDLVAPKNILKQMEKIITVPKNYENKLDKKYPIDKIFKTKEDFNNCVAMIYEDCFDKKKYDNYFKMCKEYFDEQFCGNAATFDIGYSGKPEAIITSIIDKPLTTYFIHANSSEAFKNSMIGKYDLKTFFDFKPTITGALRELLISYVGPSCIGYDYKDNKVIPIFGSNKNYNFFNIDMIEKIQKGSLDFVSDFCTYFGKYIDYIDLNKYYMSLPLEYYYHYAKKEDRIPYKNLMFDDTVNNLIELNDYVLSVYKNYSSEYNLGNKTKKQKKKKVHEPPESRIKRVIYYTIYDRGLLKEKVFNKLRRIKNRILK